MHARKCSANGYEMSTYTSHDHPSPRAVQEKGYMDHQHARDSVILWGGSHGLKKCNVHSSCNCQKKKATMRCACGQGVRERTDAGDACRRPRRGRLCRVNTRSVRKL